VKPRSLASNKPSTIGSRKDVVFIDLPTPQIEDPWMKHAGMFKDEPLFDQVLEEIATYRRELDADRPELHTEDV
jgi:hypothetical protein